MRVAASDVHSIRLPALAGRTSVERVEPVLTARLIDAPQQTPQQVSIAEPGILDVAVFSTEPASRTAPVDAARYYRLATRSLVTPGVDLYA